MKIPRVAVLLFSAFVFATPCFAHHMAVVVSRENGVDNLTSAQLSKIMRFETRKWPDGKAILLVLHRSSPGEALTLQRLNKMSSAQWQQWMNEHRDQITAVDSDAELLNLVGNSPGAIGMVDVRTVNEHVKVIHVDGKLPLENGYLPH
jgi:ABC-type phosphate transport system substrate-binding protein